MSKAVHELVIERFTCQWGAPQTTDLRRFFAEYIRELRGVSAHRLERMADYIVRRHLYRNWPTVGQCLQALHALQLQAEAETRLREAENTPPDIKAKASPESCARVDVMAREGIARLRVIGETSRALLPPPPPTDDASWGARQASLMQAGKFCLSAS